MRGEFTEMYTTKKPLIESFQLKNYPRYASKKLKRFTYGCNSVKEVVMITPDKLSVSLVESTMPSCTGYTDGKLLVEGNGGTPDYTYIWNGGSGAEASGLGKGVHTVQVKDANGCQTEKSFILN